MNAGHLKPYHIVFFIFMVANVGGALTPIGDPPLFLGYLKGVPFWWVLEHCWPLWATAVGLLLAIFFVWDMLASRKLARQKPAGDLGPAVSIYGASNLLFIGMILAAVFINPPYREMLMATALIGSLLTTARRVHVENHFNFAPIREVALLFVGIFATMVPALNYLSVHASDPAFKSALSTPGQYYYATGGLSSVLDNAPTYLTFLETELGKLDPAMVHVAREVAQQPGQSQATPLQLAGLTPDQQKFVPGALEALRYYHGDRIAQGTLSNDEVKVGFLIGDPQLNAFLVAISLGAVFFGAMTYIGNGPNFMVKAIAEQAGADCPSFFGYIIAYSLPILLPVLIIVWYIFLR
jgi:Na+/H+ antiporter NhaD/arsenite permease-like protein